MSARILVVDDILPNVRLLEAKLSSAYYDVLTASSGEEALQKIKEESPDLVLLDVMMPGMDGFEVCETIKKTPEMAHIPVVMVTALTDTADRVRGLESGADDFLSKPLNDTALMARVRSLVRLKMTVDEWRIRENTASQLGVSEQENVVMNEPVEEASVLIIEDKTFEQEKLLETLKEDKDVVTMVDNGGDALKAVGEKEYDLLVVSLNLKDEDGLRLCSHLKSNEKTRSVPILMIAEDGDIEKVAHGLEIGAHDYIVRPIDKNEFLARVRTQIRRKRFQERLRSNYEVNLSMALTDTLTGLYNRRYVEVHLEKLIQKQQAAKKCFAVLTLDIDHFKQVNDTYLHSVGDEVLKIFSSRLMDGLRSFDLVARMGGEEFVAVLPDISEDIAHMVAERLRRMIANSPFVCKGTDEPLSITTSIGGVIIHDTEDTDMEDVLKRADKQLYAAKENGRNCTYFEKAGRLDPDQFDSNERPIIQ